MFEAQAMQEKASYRETMPAGAAIGSLAGSSQVQAAPTLVRALSSVDDLNKRLHQLSHQAMEIAQAVGGPYPVGGIAKGDAPPSSAMQKLNDGVNDSHAIVSEIESALSAIRRALGG